MISCASSVWDVGSVNVTCLLCILSLQSVWVVFGENGVSAKTLVAVLSYFILSAKTKTPSLEQRLCGLQAASLYLLLLKIPGQFPSLASGCSAGCSAFLKHGKTLISGC